MARCLEYKNPQTFQEIGQQEAQALQNNLGSILPCLEIGISTHTKENSPGIPCFPPGTWFHKPLPTALGTSSNSNPHWKWLEYEVQQVLNGKRANRVSAKLSYLVQWTEYEGTAEEYSWEPIDNLENASELIAEFHQAYPDKPRPLWGLECILELFRKYSGISFILSLPPSISKSYQFQSIHSTTLICLI